MSIAEPTEDSHREAAEPTLVSRRPGHAVMSHLLSELDARHGGTTVPADLASWHTGAIGEQLVGSELAQLPEGWHVLHAVPASPVADIDHLVFGPPGVFVINTKRHPSKRVSIGTHVVWIGQRQENFYQRDLLARVEKVRAAFESNGSTSTPVHALLVFVDSTAFRMTGAQQVLSCVSDRLITTLVALEPVLSSEAVDEIFERASRPDFWGCTDDVLAEPDPTMRFLQLNVEAPSGTRLDPERLSSRHLRSSPRARRRVVRSNPVAANRVAVRLLSALAALALIPVGVGVALTIFAAIVRALLPH